MDLFSYFENEEKDQKKEEDEKSLKDVGNSMDDKKRNSSPPSSQAKKIADLSSPKISGEIIEKKEKIEPNNVNQEKEKPDFFPFFQGPSSQTPKEEPRIYKVSEISREIKASLENRFGSVWVVGEISNLSRPRSGHVYLTLKDDAAQLNGVIWRSVASKIPFDLEDGMEVLVYGRITAYSQRSSYQILIDSIEPKGIGPLQLAFEQLRKKLEKEGLFLEKHKKPIPTLPKKIGIVTSATGAAIRDMLRTIYSRFPYVQVLLYPVKVQGEGAAQEIAQALYDLNEMGEVDVIIVGRGGGSLEDLWAFNEEVVARAIFASTIPVISAVGHEVDVSISDLVADLRAPTPTAAGEKVVPKYLDILNSLESLKGRFIYGLENYVAFLRKGLENLQNRRIFQHPEEIVFEKEKDLDRLSERISRPLSEIFLRWKEKLSHQETWLQKSIQKDLEFFHHKLQALAGRVEDLSPLKILGRGYSITLDEKGQVVRNIQKLKKGMTITSLVERGKIESVIQELHE
ncbi:MAG: exodeoxyribonuclease VII large subunit, partial [Planctomycetota bacterium]